MPFLVRLPSNVVRSVVKAAPLRGVVKRSTGAAGARFTAYLAQLLTDMRRTLL